MIDLHQKTDEVYAKVVKFVKSFNTTGACIPDKHYMIDLNSRMLQVKAMIDAGEYFTINRARQYGKTTMLTALKNYLQDEYAILSLDFQALGHAAFETEGTFVQGMGRIIQDAKEFMDAPVPDKYIEAFANLDARDTTQVKMDDIFRIFSRWCQETDRPVVLMIDEVDSATNNQVFLDFLAGLRLLYLTRSQNPKFHTFQSVILAGVTDVKNLKRKLHPDESQKFNSPWNVAADFKVDMSFNVHDIAGMLREYESECHTRMDVLNVAMVIHAYTSGYPFLVSRICKLMDEDGKLAWDAHGIGEIVRRLLLEKNTLFESLIGKVHESVKLKEILKRILFSGEMISYNPDNVPMNEAEMYGFVKNKNGKLEIANRIFETRLYNFFLSEDEMQNTSMFRLVSDEKEEFIHGNRLNMEYLLERYITVFHTVYGDLDDKFDEAEGRRHFLLFVRPIINGTGNYYIEAETRNNKRMDLVIDYLGERFVVELKIWRGKVYHKQGEEQLVRYLNDIQLKKGYMLIYNFNQAKASGVTHVKIGETQLIEAMV
jgi:hypothetical protein